MEIDKKKYKIAGENYYKSKNKKNQIILAGSLRSEGNHIKRLTKKSFGKTKKWCTYSITREGYVYQHYDPKYYSDFMGNKNVDKHSISIVLENMGSLFYDDQTNEWYNWVMEVCDDDLVFEKQWKGSRYWEIYTEEQFKSTVELCKHLSDEHDIVLDSLGYNVYKRGTENFQGIVTRSNYDIDFDDLSPHFNFRRFLDEIGIDINYG